MEYIIIMMVCCCCCCYIYFIFLLLINNNIFFYIILLFIYLTFFVLFLFFGIRVTKKGLLYITIYVHIYIYPKEELLNCEGPHPLPYANCTHTAPLHFLAFARKRTSLGHLLNCAQCRHRIPLDWRN